MKINRFNLITGILYVVGFILVLLNFLTKWLNLAALCVFVVAQIMLTISLSKYCIKKSAYETSENEEIIMELALEDGMEKYVPKEKNGGKVKKFNEKVKIFYPCILSSVVTALLVVLLILSLI